MMNSQQRAARRIVLRKEIVSLDRDDRIDEVQAEMRAIERDLGAARDGRYIDLVQRYDALKTEYGRLALARDKERRPEIYRRRAA
jgi:hypothetical protein